VVGFIAMMVCVCCAPVFAMILGVGGCVDCVA